MNKKKYLLEEWFLALILVIQVCLVCAGILSRYFFNWPLSFTEELTRYLLIWLACLGISASCWRGEMIRFHWPKSESLFMQRFFFWVGFLSMSLFTIFLLYSSIQMIRIQWQYHQVTSVMAWPIVWVSLAFPLATLLLLFRMYRQIRQGRCTSASAHPG